jgi:hypothetical protein
LRKSAIELKGTIKYVVIVSKFKTSMHACITTYLVIFNTLSYNLGVRDSCYLDKLILLLRELDDCSFYSQHGRGMGESEQQTGSSNER